MHLRRHLPAALAALLTLTALARAAAQDCVDDDDWASRCEHNNGSWDRETFCEQRDTRIAAPSLLSVDGRTNGGVAVRAWDGRDVRVVERIQAWAPSREDARGIARQVEVHTSGGEIYADGPEVGSRRGYAVNYVVCVPRRMDLRLRTHNGPVSVAGVTGRIDVEADNGPLALHDLGGDVHARAQNGPLAVTLSGSRWEGTGLDAATTNGPVTLSIPDGYHATLTTGTVKGPMEVDIPVTIQGRFPRQFTTELGGGGAPIRVVTTNGPVRVHQR